MATQSRLERMALALGLVLLLGTTSGCLVGRTVKLDTQWNIPNTITDKGFRYVKKGIEVRYKVDGIWPAHLTRAELQPKLAVAHSAYYHFWKKAGGLKDNQRLVNVVVETSFVLYSGGMRNSMFMVVHMYADVVELDAAAPAAPATPPTGGVSDPSRHPSARPMMLRIASSLTRALARLPKS